MADSDLAVTISGAALSLLFYENVRSPGDQMGFLLGETLEFVVKSYTDAENQVETVKIHNNIETVITCPLPELLHNSIGRINKEKLKDFVHDKSKQVIGWFRFRRNTNLVPTMRDKILHREFSSYFSAINGSKEELFVTCLLSSSTNDIRGTHKFKHVCLRRKTGTLEPVPLRINNLGNDSFRHDGSDYKLTPTKKSLDAPDGFTKLIESLGVDVTGMASLQSAVTIQKAAERYLNDLIPRVCESDLEVADLERQVREWRTTVASYKEPRTAKVNGSTDVVEENCKDEKGGAGEEARTTEQTSPSRIESSDVCKNTRILKDHSTSASHTVTVSKARNTAACIEKSVNQGKTRIDKDKVNSPNQEPHVNTVSEKRNVDIGESVSNKIKRAGIASEIVKESICKKEGHETGVGRGRASVMHDFSPVLKNTRRSLGPGVTRSSIERRSLGQLPEQHSSEANSVKNTPLTYSQASKKNLDNARNTSSSSDNH